MSNGIFKPSSKHKKRVALPQRNGLKYFTGKRIWEYIRTFPTKKNRTYTQNMKNAKMPAVSGYSIMLTAFSKADTSKSDSFVCCTGKKKQESPKYDLHVS